MSKAAAIGAILLGLQASAVLASDGTVSVLGSVGTTTCVINGTNGGDISVNLPQVGSMDLSSPGQTAGVTPFSISLTQCDSIGAQAHFELSNAIDQATGNLYNVGGASGVEVQLLNGAFQPINLVTNNNSQNITLVGTAPNKSGVLNYYAQYIAVAGGASSGSVKASVQYSMIYN